MDTKKEICYIGKKITKAGLVTACDGNISVRCADGSILITPSQKPKGEVRKKDILRVSLTGHVLEGNGKPSSETSMHIQIYSKRPDVKAIVHAHPITATALSVAAIPFPSDLVTEGELILGHVPTIPYALPGSMELATAAAVSMLQANVGLLERHGAIALGESLTEALYRMETLETVAKMYRDALLFASLREDEAPHSEEKEIWSSPILF